MKALRKLQAGYGNMDYIKVEKPLSLNQDELLIKVTYTGICGTDIHAYKGEYNKVIPLTLGHEFVGIVAKVGSCVSSFSIGDRIVSETTFETCGTCHYCYEESYNLCSKRKGIGTQVDGSFANFVIAKAKRCHHVPYEIDDKSAAMLEPLACCIHAINEKTTVKAAEKIAIFGPGPIGMLMALVLMSLRAEVILIGVDKDNHRLELAKQLSIPHVINSQKQNLYAEIEKLTNKNGVDQVIECSGNIFALNDAFKIVKKKGKIIQEGLFAEDKNTINMSLLINKEIMYIGSRTQKPSSWKTAIEWLTERRLNIAPIVTQIFSLEDWEKAFELAMTGNELKILLKPD